MLILSAWGPSLDVRFRRQILTSLDARLARLWRLKSVPAMKGLIILKSHISRLIRKLSPDAGFEIETLQYKAKRISVPHLYPEDDIPHGIVFHAELVLEQRLTLFCAQPEVPVVTKLRKVSLTLIPKPLWPEIHSFVLLIP